MVQRYGAKEIAESELLKANRFIKEIKSYIEKVDVARLKK